MGSGNLTRDRNLFSAAAAPIAERYGIRWTNGYSTDTTCVT